MGVIGKGYNFFNFNNVTRNISSIQGVTQAVNGYHFLLTTLQVVAKVFQFSRLGNFANSWQFEQLVWINGFSLIHRVALLYFNIQKLESLNGVLKLSTSMGVELFFIVRKHLPATVSGRNLFGDLLIGIPYLLYGLYNIRGEETSSERSIASTKKAMEYAVLLEVQVENGRYLEAIQQNLENLDEIEHICEELHELKALLESSADLEEEFKNLEWLSTIVCGNQSNAKKEEDELHRMVLNESGRPPKEQIRNKLRLFAVKLAKTMIDPDSRNTNLAQLLNGNGEEPGISKREKTFREKKKELKVKKQSSSTDKVQIPKLEAEIRQARAELRMIKFVANPLSLEEELESLKKLKDKDILKKLSAKKAALTQLIDYIEREILGSQIDQREGHLISLRSQQEKNVKALKNKPDVQDLGIDANIERQFDSSFDIYFLEVIAVKLIDCDRFIQRLKASTSEGKDGTGKGIYEWLEDANNVGGLRSRVASLIKGDAGGLPFDPTKIVEKKDLYAAIITEKEIIDDLLLQLSKKISPEHSGMHPSLVESFRDFKSNVDTYLYDVGLLFSTENDGDRAKKFQDASLYKVLPFLRALRSDFQKEHNVLLKSLEGVIKLDKPSDWGSYFRRYFRPWSYIAVGVALLAIRFFKSQDWIAPRGQIDIGFDAVLGGCLALSHLVPLFFDPKVGPKPTVILYQGKDISTNENTVKRWYSNSASFVSSVVDFFKSPKST